MSTKRAEIITVGTELLLGEVLDTNSFFLSQQMAAMGIDVYYKTMVGDNEDRMLEAVKTAASRADLVVLVGGLGPTKDDLTKQVAAKYLKRELKVYEPALEKIKKFFAGRDLEMTANNVLQAKYIEGSQILKNEVGLAVGDFYQGKEGEPDFLLLPGPPYEMKPMFLDAAKPVLEKAYYTKHKLYSRMLRFFGISESQLDEKLVSLTDHQTNPTIAPYVKHDDIVVRLTASAANEADAKKMLDEKEKEVQDLIGDYFYGYGEENSLAQVVVHELEAKQLTISASESLTAGKFQSTLASVPGVSQVFFGGFVTYDARAKERFIAVPHETIEKYGVVSRQTAIAMADGTKAKAGTDIAISFTGVAGPGELEGHPAGTVWIGLAIAGRPTSAQLIKYPAQTRESIRRRAVATGLNMIHKAISR